MFSSLLAIGFGNLCSQDRRDFDCVIYSISYISLQYPFLFSPIFVVLHVIHSPILIATSTHEGPPVFVTSRFHSGWVINYHLIISTNFIVKCYYMAVPSCIHDRTTNHSIKYTIRYIFQKKKSTTWSGNSSCAYCPSSYIDPYGNMIAERGGVWMTGVYYRWLVVTAIRVSFVSSPSSSR